MKLKIFDKLLILKILFKNITKLKSLFEEQFVLVTASDARHFIYLKNLVNNYYKIVKKKQFTKLLIFDLGLRTNQIEELLKHKFIDLRKFPFKEYPEFFSLRLPEHNNKIGGFAWKPAILDILREEKIKNIIWLDSATLFNKKILLFKLLTLEKGFMSFCSTGKIKDWTHPNALEELGLNNNLKILNSPNLLAGVVGFSFKTEFGNKLIKKWLVLSLQKNLIFPKKSSVLNHRHDQSLLSISYWLQNEYKLPKNPETFGIKIQNWPDKILFFYDEKNMMRKKLLGKYYSNSTTTNSRAKIFIIFNVNSLKNIPLRVLLTKKILLFVTDSEEMKVLQNYFFKKRFLNIYLDKNCKQVNKSLYKIIDFGYKEVDEIIEKEFNFEFYGKK